MDASSCGVQIQLEKLPLSAELKTAATQFHFDPLEAAFVGGEDYVLLFTLAANKVKLDRPFYKIGTITNHLGKLELTHNGQPVILKTDSFKHF
jgi:thiamine monophosphate kinase